MNIKQMRLQRGLKQKYVAEQLGISTRHYQRIENEGREPTKEQEEGLALIFRCKVSQICDKKGGIQ